MGRLNVNTDKAILQQYETIVTRIRDLQKINKLSQFQLEEHKQLENALAKVKMKMMLKNIEVPSK